MSDHSSGWQRRFVVIADAVFLLLAGLALLIQSLGGVKWLIGPIPVTASSGARAAELALAVLAVRHAIVGRPWFGARCGRWFRRTRAFIGAHERRFANTTDLTIAGLAAIAFGIDLIAGASARTAEPAVAPPTGTAFALASLGLLAIRLIVLGRAASVLSPSRTAAGAPAWAFSWPARREWLAATLIMTGATVVLLRQQWAAFTSVPDLGDPLFSMWRLGWVAHQLPLDPAHLFDANIFYPAARTLAYSDSMLVPGLMAAPALWLGVPLPVVYTTLFLLTFVAGGVAMFALMRVLTGQAGPALLAGLFFAFDPFRIAHYSHLELQFTFWMPLALLAFIRTTASGRLRDGILTGVLVALQAMSSLYYAAYFGVAMAVFAIWWMWRVARPTRRGWEALAAGGLIAAVAAVFITAPYRANRLTIGERTDDEIRYYSGSIRDYAIAHPRSRVYGSWLTATDGSEHELFPGGVAIALATGAVLPPFSRGAGPAAMALAVGIDASFGLNGTVYSALSRLGPFHGFRVPTRFRAVIGVFLAMLIGYGSAGFARRLNSAKARQILLLAMGAALAVDLQPVLELQPVWLRGPGIYQHIPEPKAVIADMPLPGEGDPFWHDPVYMYFSTFHWRRLVNGNSGFIPARYPALGAASHAFPSDESLDVFRRLGTEYFVLHAGYYHDDFSRVVAAAEAQPRLQFVATDTWEEGESRLYRLLR